MLSRKPSRDTFGQPLQAVMQHAGTAPSARRELGGCPGGTGRGLTPVKALLGHLCPDLKKKHLSENTFVQPTSMQPGSSAAHVRLHGC